MRPNKKDQSPTSSMRRFGNTVHQHETLEDSAGIANLLEKLASSPSRSPPVLVVSKLASRAARKLWSLNGFQSTAQFVPSTLHTLQSSPKPFPTPQSPKKTSERSPSGCKQPGLV
eukprot:4949877-Amphidinium_carterae.2